MRYEVKTHVQEGRFIVQECRMVDDDDNITASAAVQRSVIDLQEEQVQRALIAAGWSPPPTGVDASMLEVQPHQSRIKLPGDIWRTVDEVTASAKKNDPERAFYPFRLQREFNAEGYPTGKVTQHYIQLRKWPQWAKTALYDVTSVSPLERAASSQDDFDYDDAE